MYRSSCPSPEQLEQLLSGTLADPPASAIEAHWLNCPACEQTVVQFEAAHDTVVAQLRACSPVSAEVAPDDSPVARAIERIAAERPTKGAIPAQDAAPSGETAPHFPRGSLGAYELLEPIGQGGMGTVYRGRHQRLGQEVAIKVVPGGQVQNQEMIARFEREMQAIGRLKHPHLVKAQDAGETEGNEYLYLVMELLEGVDAAALLRRHGRLPVTAACAIAQQAAQALRYVHQQQMIHRDVKPSNLMVTRDGTVKLLDLGLALLGDSPEKTLTVDGQVMGTLDYMAPEQAHSSHRVDTASDVYALGCTLFALLAGTAPFGSEQYARPVQKLMAHATATPPHLADLRPDLPAAVADLVRRMLNKLPADRPTLEEALDTLTPYAAGANLAALLDAPAGPSAQPAANPRVEAVAAKASASPLNSDRDWRTWTGIALLLLVAGFAVGQIIVIVRNNGEVEKIELAENEVVTIDGKTGQALVRPAPPAAREEKEAVGEFLPLLGSRALVAEPRKLPGVDSWTVETVAPRGRIYAARFSPSGKHVAVWSEDGVLRLWDASSAALVGMFHSPPGLLSAHSQAFDFTSDGRRVIIAAGNLRMWEVESGRLVWEHRMPAGEIPPAHRRVAISPNGQWLATDLGRNIQIWKADSGQPSHALTLTEPLIAIDPNSWFAWSPDSRQLVAVAALDHTQIVVEQFDVADRRRLRSGRYDFGGGANPIERLEWSPDAARIVLSGIGWRLLWNAKAWQPGESFASPPNPGADAVRWLDGGRRLAAGDLLFEFVGGKAAPLAAGSPLAGRDDVRDWSPDGQRAVLVERGGKLSIVAATAAAPPLVFARNSDAGMISTRREWQSNETLLYGGWSWNVVEGKRLEPAPPFAGQQVHYDVILPSPDGKYLFISEFQNEANTYRPAVLRTRDGSRPDLVLKEGDQPVSMGPVRFPVVWSADSRHVALLCGGFVVRTWDARTGKLVGAVKTPLGAFCLAMSPDGRMVFAGGHGAQFLVRNVDGSVAQDLVPPQHREPKVFANFGFATWSRDGRLWRVLGSGGQTITWDAQTGAEVSRMTFRFTEFGEQKDPRKSPDERRFDIEGANCVYLFDTDTFRSLGTLVQLGEPWGYPHDPPRWFFVSPEGRIRGQYYPHEDIRYVVLREGAVNLLSSTAFLAQFPALRDAK